MKLQGDSELRWSRNWVGLTRILVIPAWADGSLAELAGKLNKMMEHPN